MEIEVESGDTFGKNDMLAWQARGGKHKVIGIDDWDENFAEPTDRTITLADFTRIAEALGHTVKVIAPESEIETVPWPEYAVVDNRFGGLVVQGTKSSCEEFVRRWMTKEGKIVRLAPPASREDDGPFWWLNTNKKVRR